MATRTRLRASDGRGRSKHGYYKYLTFKQLKTEQQTLSREGRWVVPRVGRSAKERRNALARNRDALDKGKTLPKTETGPQKTGNSSSAPKHGSLLGAAIADPAPASLPGVPGGDERTPSPPADSPLIPPESLPKSPTKPTQRLITKPSPKSALMSPLISPLKSPPKPIDDVVAPGKTPAGIIEADPIGSIANESTEAGDKAPMSTGDNEGNGQLKTPSLLSQTHKLPPAYLPTIHETIPASSYIALEQQQSGLGSTPLPSDWQNLDDAERESWLCAQPRLRVGDSNTEFHQIDVVGDGLCLYRAFGMAFYHPHVYHEKDMTRIMQSTAKTAVQLEVNRWWQTVKNKPNSRESRARKDLYRALNEQWIRDHKVAQDIQSLDHYHATGQQPSPTKIESVNGPRSGSLAAAAARIFAANPQQRIWPDESMMQLLADAYDVELFCHNAEVDSPDRVRWQTNVRGLFGTRQIHVFRYGSMRHFTSGTVVDDSEPWTEHINQSKNLDDQTHRIPFFSRLSDKVMYHHLSGAWPRRFDRALPLPVPDAPHQNHPTRVVIPQQYRNDVQCNNPRFSTSSGKSKCPANKAKSPELPSKKTTHGHGEPKANSVSEGGVQTAPPGVTLSQVQPSPPIPARTHIRDLSPDMSVKNVEFHLAGKRQLRGVGRLDETADDYEQYCVGGDGACMLRAFGLSYYYPDVRDVATLKDREDHACSLVRDHLLEWWDLTTHRDNSQGPESRARRPYYRAMNEQGLRENISQADVKSLIEYHTQWLCNNDYAGPSPTRVEAITGELRGSLAKQVSSMRMEDVEGNPETDRVYPDESMLQVLADAYDVEVLVHTPNIDHDEAQNRTGDLRWTTMTRGLFGARQIHMVLYGNIIHYTWCRPINSTIPYTRHVRRSSEDQQMMRLPYHNIGDQCYRYAELPPYPAPFTRTRAPPEPEEGTADRRITIPAQLAHVKGMVADPVFQGANVVNDGQPANASHLASNAQASSHHPASTMSPPTQGSGKKHSCPGKHDDGGSPKKKSK